MGPHGLIAFYIKLILRTRARNSVCPGREAADISFYREWTFYPRLLPGVARNSR